MVLNSVDIAVCCISMLAK
ncbi:MAG TPA: hypothetical protein EYG48_09335 [Methylococcales bacterium]|nr:hypothetical protein [Methylococcales bacterium]